jgi:hypothetical protein
MAFRFFALFKVQLNFRYTKNHIAILFIVAFAESASYNLVTCCK